MPIPSCIFVRVAYVFHPAEKDFNKKHDIEVN